jgi:hypothetical protein
MKRNDMDNEKPTDCQGEGREFESLFPLKGLGGATHPTDPAIVSKLSAPQTLTIRVKRTRHGFEAAAHGQRPTVDVSAIADTAKHAVNECMDGVAACLADRGEP